MQKLASSFLSKEWRTGGTRLFLIPLSAAVSPEQWRPDQRGCFFR